MTAVADRNIQVVAWVVMLVATLVFATLIVGLPWLGLRYYRTATVEEEATVECKEGTCSLASGSGMPIVLRAGDAPDPVLEGVTFATDGSARGFVRFVNDSIVNLEPDTAVTFDRMRRSRFASRDDGRQIALEARQTAPGTKARLSIGTTWRDAETVLDTPHGRISVGPASRARLELTDAQLRVTGLEGRVTVAGSGKAVTLGDGERTEVSAGGLPADPHRAIENIVVNSDFDQRPEEAGWSFRIDRPDGPAVDDPGRAFHDVLDDGRTVVRIERLGSEGRSADVIYEQQLGDLDVSAATYIGVEGLLRVIGQSLPLGGQLGSELPLIIKLTYESANGEPYGWVVGFHAVEPGPDEPEGKYVLRTDYTNVRVPLSEWYAFDSGNLLDSQSAASFERFGWPRPERLKRLEIIASGHDYAADVDEIAVWVR